MNAKMKKRMIAVSGVIVIVLILVLAFVGGNTAATTMSIAEAAENPQAGQKVQVSGNVVQDSFSTSNDVLTFKIYDPEGDPATQLEVRYDGAGSLKAAGQSDRFILVDAETGDSMPVVFEGALSDGIADGSAVVLTGSLGADGKFAATDVALEG